MHTIEVEPPPAACSLSPFVRWRSYEEGTRGIDAAAAALSRDTPLSVLGRAAAGGASASSPAHAIAAVTPSLAAPSPSEVGLSGDLAVFSVA